MQQIKKALCLIFLISLTAFSLSQGFSLTRDLLGQKGSESYSELILLATVLICWTLTAISKFKLIDQVLGKEDKSYHMKASVFNSFFGVSEFLTLGLLLPHQSLRLQGSFRE